MVARRFKTSNILWFMVLPSVVSMAGCKGIPCGRHHGGGEGDTIAPFVTSTVPPNAATGVAINTKITAAFSEAIDPSTIKK